MVIAPPTSHISVILTLRDCWVIFDVNQYNFWCKSIYYYIVLCLVFPCTLFLPSCWSCWDSEFQPKNIPSSGPLPPKKNKSWPCWRWDTSRTWMFISWPLWSHCLHISGWGPLLSQKLWWWGDSAHGSTSLVIHHDRRFWEFMTTGIIQSMI